MKTHYYIPIFLISLLLGSCAPQQNKRLMSDEAYMTSADFQKHENELRAALISQNMPSRTEPSAQNQNNNYDYYDENYNSNSRFNRIPGPGYSPYGMGMHDPYWGGGTMMGYGMGMYPSMGMGMNMGMGMGMSSMMRPGMSMSLCYNCYDPFRNPYGWMPYNAHYGFGAHSFYNPMMDPFFNPYNPWGFGGYGFMNTPGVFITNNPSPSNVYRGPRDERPTIYRGNTSSSTNPRTGSGGTINNRSSRTNNNTSKSGNNNYTSPGNTNTTQPNTGTRSRGNVGTPNQQTTPRTNSTRQRNWSSPSSSQPSRSWSSPSREDNSSRSSGSYSSPSRGGSFSSPSGGGSRSASPRGR